MKCQNFQQIDLTIDDVLAQPLPDEAHRAEAVSLKKLLKGDGSWGTRIEGKTDDASSAKEGGTMVTDTTTTGSGAGNESSTAEE